MESREKDRPSSQPPEFTTWHAFLWMLGALISVVLFIGFVHSILPHIGRDLVSLGVLSTLVFLALTAFLLSRYPAGDRLGDAIGTRPTHVFAIPLALAIGVATRGPAEAFRSFSAQFVEVSDQAQQALHEMSRVGSPVHAAFLFLAMALLVPLGEEFFFRGGIYGALRRSGRSSFHAALVTTLGFALSHPQALLPMTLVAAVFGFLRASSGSLLPALSAHVAFNAVEVLEMTHQEYVPSMDSQLMIGSSVGLLALLSLFFVFVWRNPTARKSRILEGQGALAPPSTTLD